MSFYQFYEFNHAALAPWRAVADATRLTFQNPFNPLYDTPFARSVTAAAELFERSTRRYGKPEFGLHATNVDGMPVAVEEQVVWRRPFCSLLHFKRDLPAGRDPDPKLLIVAPMSGHYATLLRGTVEAMLPDHEVFITDWADARLLVQRHEATCHCGPIGCPRRGCVGQPFRPGRHLRFLRRGCHYPHRC